MARGQGQGRDGGRIGLLDRGQLATLLAIPDLPSRLEEVDTLVSGALSEFKAALRPEVFAFLTGPAKRIRATLTIACAQLGGSHDARVATAAAIVELVQMGSLIHDDIIEEASSRRGKPTLNSVESTGVALVVGDLVLAEAGLLAAKKMHKEASALMADTMAHMAAGQLEELRDLMNLDRTLEQYRAATEAKTGTLFAAACRLGGMLVGMPPRKLDAVTAFGTAFGVQYQLIDDVLDLIGDPNLLGKPVGRDLATGTYTEPVIRALAKRGGKTLAALLKRRRAEDLAEALERVKKSGAVEDAIKAVTSLSSEATRALNPFTNDPVGRGDCPRSG
ncbi:MAG: polyprenyl synthetase family protein [Actinomycetota bacterium]